MRKVRIVLSELFYIQSQIIEQSQLGNVRGPTENIIKQSELFDNEIYLEEITFIICIALAELPSLFNIQEVIETLLYVSGGTSIICYVVANMPDCFKEVVTALISNGDEETADGRLRMNALSCLCDMNPGQALSTRTLCVEMGRMPSLMLRLSLIDPIDLVGSLDSAMYVVLCFSSSVLTGCVRVRPAARQRPNHPQLVRAVRADEPKAEERRPPSRPRRAPEAAAEHFADI